jgi:hypothetical protein
MDRRENWGTTDMMHKQVSSTANKIALIGGITMLIVLLNGIGSIPYIEYVVLLSIGLTFITLGLGLYYKNEFRLLRELGHEEKPSFLLLLIPSLSPLIYWLSSGWEIKQILLLFLYTILIAAVLCFLVMKSSKGNHLNGIHDFMMATGVFIFLLGATFGILVFINGMDDFTAKEHQVLIMDKGIDLGGEEEVYYLVLEPWGKDSKKTNVTVSETVFESIGKGESIAIESREGNLGIEWFSIEGTVIN